MNPSRLFAAALAVTLAGCGGDTTAPEPEVVSVVVTPSSGTLDAPGASVQFTASAKDASGSVVSGKSVTWASSDQDVATISSSGLATAVAPGTTAITATVEGVAGAATLTVSEASQACNNAKTVTLAVGESQTYEGSDCIILPAGLSGDRYRVAVTRPASAGTASDVLIANLKVVGLGVAQAPEPVRAPSLVDAAAQSRLTLRPDAFGRAMRVADATARDHARRYAQETAEAVALIRRDGRKAIVPLVPRAALRGPEAADAPAKRTFDVSASGCDGTSDLITGLLIWQNDDVAFYQDSTQNAADPVQVSSVQQIGEYFTAYGKPAVEDYFGELPDIDHDGRLTVLVSPVVNDQTAAFVSRLDVFTTSTCATSNEADLVYFSLLHIKSIADGDFQAVGTLAHEAKHVVESYHRAIASNRMGSNQYDPMWIYEGTADIAMEMSSRYAWDDIGGPAINGQVTRQSYVDTPGNFVEENWGVLLAVGRGGAYLASQPNGLVVVPSGAAENADIYGSGWLFQRWLGDAYGHAASSPKADSSLFRAVLDSLMPGGTAGLTAVVGKPFLELFDEFVVANSLHVGGAPTGDLAYTSYDFVSAGQVYCEGWNPLGDFPFPVTTTGTRRDCANNVTETTNPSATFGTATYSGPIGISGIRTHDFLSNGTGTGAQITLNMGGEPAKMVVVRLR